MSRTTIATLESRMNAQDERLDRIEAMLGRIADSLESATQQKTTTTTSSKKKSAPKPLVDFRKADGSTRKCTEAQAAAWTKWRDGASDRKEAFEQMKAGWAEKKATYKPSKELVDAIKANRAAITHTIAKEKYGFVGTKPDLRALKAEILGC